MTATTTPPTPAAKRSRSPGYPSYPLDEVIEKARLIYQAARKSPATPDAIYRYLGYGGMSGRALSWLATLKYFALLSECDGKNTRLLELTPLALRIIIDADPASAARIAAIKEAAITPKIYAELWQQYGTDLPPDQALRTMLLLNRNFTEAAVDDFIANYRKTIAFAALQPGDGPVQSEPEAPAPGGAGIAALPTPLAAAAIPKQQTSQNVGPIREIIVPLGGGRAVIQVPYPLSAESFERLKKHIDLCKDDLVVTNG